MYRQLPWLSPPAILFPELSHRLPYNSNAYLLYKHTTSNCGEYIFVAFWTSKPNILYKITTHLTLSFATEHCIQDKPTSYFLLPVVFGSLKFEPWKNKPWLVHPLINLAGVITLLEYGYLAPSVTTHPSDPSRFVHSKHKRIPRQGQA